MDIKTKIETINKLIKELNEEGVRVKAVGKYCELYDIKFVEQSTVKID